MAAWRPIPAGVWHDDGVYMLVGKALAEGHGLVYNGVVGTPPAAKFPPLYSGFLAILWRMLGEIGAVTLAATVLNVGFLAVAGALFAKALHTSAGLSPHVSIASAGLAFISTDLIRTALVPMSESLFMLLMMGALGLWARTRSKRADGRPGRLTWADACLATLLLAAVATRTAGLALTLAFGLALARPRGFMVAAITTLPALLTAWSWTRWSGIKSAEISEGARDVLGSYGGWLADQTLSAPVAYLTGLPAHALGVLERVAVISLPGLTGWFLFFAAVPLAIIALVGLHKMLYSFPPLGWLTLGYFAMLLLWPYLDRRLVVPLHPAVVAAFALGTVELLGRVRSRSLEILLLVGVALWAAAYSSVTVSRIAEGWPTAPYRLRAERLAAAVEAMSRTVPPEATVGAPEFWPALHLHGGWTVAPSARFDPRNVDPSAPIWGTPDEQIALWRASGIDHVLLEHAGRLHGATLDQMENSCPGSIVVLAQMESSVLVRIDWDAVCGTAGANEDRPG